MRLRRVAFVAGTAAALVLGGLSLHERLRMRTVRAQQPAAVEIFACVANPFNFLHQSSSAAPPVTATTCAQALADSLNQGFKIVSTTELSGGLSGDQYTLVLGEGGS